MTVRLVSLALCLLLCKALALSQTNLITSSAAVVPEPPASLSHPKRPVAFSTLDQPAVSTAPPIRADEAGTIETTEPCTPKLGVVNVLDCGAVADGAYVAGACGNHAPMGCYQGTDNVAAIRKAIAALPPAGGTISFSSSGTNIWMLGASSDGTDDCSASTATGGYGLLNLPNNVTLQGDGQWTTVLMANPGVGIARTCAMIQNSTTPARGITIRGMRLDGNEGTDSTHNDWLHPSNNLATSTNHLMAIDWQPGRVNQKNPPPYGPSLTMRNFQISGFAGSGPDGPWEHAAVYANGNSWLDWADGWVAFNQWSHGAVFTQPDSIFHNIYWQSNGGWNGLEGLIVGDGGEIFIGNYFGGGSGGSAQVLIRGGFGNKFIACVNDNTVGNNYRFVDSGDSYAADNTIVGGSVTQPGNNGTASAFISFEGHAHSNVVADLAFHTGNGHSTYGVQELASATGNNIIGATFDPNGPPGIAPFSLSRGSRATGTVGGADTPAPLRATTLAVGQTQQTGPLPVASAGTVLPHSTNTGGAVSLNGATSLTISFAGSTWTKSIFCVATAGVSLAEAPYVSSISLTSVTFQFSSLTGNIYYHCDGS